MSRAPAPPQEIAMDPGYAAVLATLSRYFDGLYNSDTELLGGVFHPQARYLCATDGNLVNLGMDDYFPIVDRRPSPASRGEPRRDKVLSIEFAGPVTAFARVECAIGPKHFTDFLSLVFTEGQWRVVAKVFHYDLIETPAPAPGQSRLASSRFETAATRPPQHEVAPQ